MTHPASGNTAWQDWPSTATLISAGRMEAIETALDSTVDKPFARYTTVASPTTPPSFTFAAARQRIPFTVEQDAHVAVVPNGAKTAFTLNQAGVWRIEAGIRLSASTANQVKYFGIGNDADLTLGGFVEVQELRNATSGALCASVTRRLAFGTAVSATLLIAGGSSTATIANDIPDVTFISFSWIRP